VPVGLGATITTAVLSGAAVATATAALVTQTTATTMNLFNLKTAAAIVATAALTGTTTHFVQEREAARLRAENASINETHAKLMGDRQEAMALVQLRDEQIAALKREVADLPRLRGEVDKLNRNLAGKAALEAENAALRLQVQSARATPNQASPVADTEPPEVALDERLLERYGQWTADDVTKAQQRRMVRHRELGVALLAHADDASGWFPQDLVETKPYLTEQFDFKNLKLTFTGNIKDLKNPSRTIIARQDSPSKLAEGGYVWRVYTFGDGHAEVITATTMQALTNWENERILPPESQSRRP